MGNAYIIPAYDEFIGKGSFGYVYRGTYGKQPCAVKTINTHMLKDEYKNIEKNEVIPFIKGLKHPNIVTIYAWEDKGHEIWLALELCDTDLYKYLKDHDPNNDETWDIIQQCANGLCYLHRNNVIHRDVRPDNYLVVMENGRAVIKVTDFSLCKDVDSELGSTMTTVRGNKNWLAPELLTEDGKRATDARYKRSIDVFSLALVIIYVLVNNTGRQRFLRKCCGAIVKSGGDVFSLFDELWRSTELKYVYMPLLHRMIELEPEVRSTMEEVMMTFRPPTASTAPRLVLQTSHRLGYQADYNVGIGGRHLILLGCEDPHTLHLLQLQGDGYQQLWRKYCPQGVDYNDRKYVASDDSLITRHWTGSDPTRCWSRELAPLHTHTVGGDRVLIAVLPDHSLVYREEIDGGWQLVLCDGDQRVCTLRPPADTRWSINLSICRHPASGWMAVADCITRTLTVFDRAGQIQHRARLDYTPGLWDAITSTAAHLVVRELATTVLHVHAWDGKEVGRLDLRQVAELGEGEDRVHSVGVCEDVLHVAVGGGGYSYYVSSLHALRVQ